MVQALLPVCFLREPASYKMLTSVLAPVFRATPVAGQGKLPIAGAGKPSAIRAISPIEGVLARSVMQVGDDAFESIFAQDRWVCNPL